MTDTAGVGCPLLAIKLEKHHFINTPMSIRKWMAEKQGTPLR